MEVRLATSNLAVCGAGSMTTRPKDGTPVMEARLNTDNPREGYIKLFRSILKHPLFEDHPPEYLKIWIYLLCKATRKPRRWWDGSGEVLIPIGGLVSSLNKIAAACCVSRGQVERALQVFTQCQMIETPTGTKPGQPSRHNGSLHVVVNFATYQAYAGETETPTETLGGHQPGRQQDASQTPVGRQQDISTIGKREIGGKAVVAEAGASVNGNIPQPQPPATTRIQVVTPKLSGPETVPEPDNHDRHALAHALIDELLPLHPGGGGKAQAVIALCAIIANVSPVTDEDRRWTAEPVETCNMIRSAHGRWRDALARGQGNSFQMKITLSRWISDRDWLRVPIETVDQKTERVIVETLAEISARKRAQ